jgi:transposase
MIFSGQDIKVHLAMGHTDMRKAINGLAILVEQHLEKDPFSGHLFAFCNRTKTIVKILYWDRNGFCLWQKRLEKHRFKWPNSQQEVLCIGYRELQWLLEGLDPLMQNAHSELNYKLLS